MLKGLLKARPKGDRNGGRRVAERWWKGVLKAGPKGDRTVAGCGRNVAEMWRKGGRKGVLKSALKDGLDVGRMWQRRPAGIARGVQKMHYCTVRGPGDVSGILCNHADGRHVLAYDYASGPRSVGWVVAVLNLSIRPGGDAGHSWGTFRIRLASAYAHVVVHFEHLALRPIILLVKVRHWMSVNVAPILV